MNMKHFKKESLPLDIIVEELQLILKSYKEFQNSNIAKYFDNLFNKTIIDYKLSRLELINKVLGR